MDKPEAAGVAGDVRPYHHGDLRRALIQAAERILVRDGPQGLSLRAVAREAGVSPAAPYHHFKDKSDLLSAIAEAGFDALSEAIRSALAAEGEHKMVVIGAAYVKFAREHPALYRVMYDCARNSSAMPDSNQHDKSGFRLLEQAMIQAGADPAEETSLKLWCIAAWCSAHGVAEMVGFDQFKPVIEALGGEDMFIKALISRICRSPGDHSWSLDKL
jgi:AcrR family transcriptional regulator